MYWRMNDIHFSVKCTPNVVTNQNLKQERGRKDFEIMWKCNLKEMKDEILSQA